MEVILTFIAPTWLSLLPTRQKSITPINKLSLIISNSARRKREGEGETGEEGQQERETRALIRKFLHKISLFKPKYKGERIEGLFYVEEVQGVASVNGTRAVMKGKETGDGEREREKSEYKESVHDGKNV